MGLAIEAGVARAMMILIRVGLLCVFVPFFDGPSIPPRVKMGLTLAFSALLYPIVPNWPAPADLGAWMLLAAGEAVVALLLGLALHVVIDGAQLAGQVMGFQLGFSLVNVVDPMSEIDTTVLSVFHQLIAMLIFLSLNVHHAVLRAVAASFRSFPPGQVFSLPFTGQETLRLTASLWTIAIQLAAPVLLATALIDVILGFLAKASPQLPALFIGLSVKHIVGVAVLLGALASWPLIFKTAFRNSFFPIEKLFLLGH